MTNKQKIIFQAFRGNKTNLEICKMLKINLSNLHSTCWQMRQHGVVLTRTKAKKQPSPTQLAILKLYAQSIPVPQIAAQMEIESQTVMNHATEGFKRLGFTTPGVNRIKQIRAYFGIDAAKSPTEITMDDPFFN